MLQKHGVYNDLSAKLRSELTEKVKSYGKTVRVKFDVAKPNPDPEKYNGALIYPGLYVLDPITFRITDPYEERPDVSRAKEIGLINKIDKEGRPESFFRIRVYARHKGVLTFKPEENIDDFEYLMYILLHPKLKGGKFAPKEGHFVIEIIDEKRQAKVEREQRTAKKKASDVAYAMKDEEIVQFADAMLWDSTEEMDLLRNKVEAEAEMNPEIFNDLVSGKNLEYQALVKRALDKQVWAFDPAQYKFIWSANQQTITVLQPVGDKNEVQKMAEWLQVGGKQADEVYKKTKTLINN